MPSLIMTASDNWLKAGNRYQLQRPLAAGGMGTVYAAYDRLTGQQVALKQAHLSPMQPLSPELRLALAHEFQALASLRHPYIITVQDYGFDQAQQPYFTMELLPDGRPLTDAAAFLPAPAKIDLLIQLLQALVYVHRRGIIHRDLKPGNVLVSGGQVRLLDFGLAAVAGQESAPSGTLPYMAPEIIRARPATIASDLYAVGVLAYELLAGWHPFAQANSLIHAILLEPPDFTYLELDPPLIAVLQTLLAKEPTARYPDAATAIQALCHACGRSLPPESTATRDSFIQAAPFIGREKELADLLAALNQAINGVGGRWLVRGESGLGKSRLLQELRTQALVQGAMVMWGMGRPDGRAYHLWGDGLRPLLLLAEPDELDAAVLSAIIPDIEQLLGWAIPPAPPLNAKAAQTRLHLAVANLLRRAAADRPLLLLLEDMHWADAASLELLRFLAGQLQHTRLLFVGSYRPGERPGLAQELPGFNLLPLPRLAADQVADLCAAVLGENGRQPHLVHFVQQQSEGNTFFIVEVMRILAEATGRLDEITTMALPHSIFAGGMQQVVARRLARLPALYQPLLHSAAAAGRQLDLSLLAHLFPQANIEEWLTLCANAAVLERPAGGVRWQFSHDKLRQGALAQLDAPARSQLHAQIAHGLEKIYAANLGPHYGDLAHHFGQAEQVDRQAAYLALAARQADAAYANEQALAYYQQLLPLLGDAVAKVKAQGQMGRIYKRIGQWEASEAIWRDGLAAALQLGDAALQGQFLLDLGSLERGRGRYATALDWLEQARYLHQQQGDFVHLCNTLVEIGNVYYQQGQYEVARQHLSEAFNVAEAAADSTSLALVQHNLGSIAYAQGDYQTAQPHYTNALIIRQTLGDKSALADSYNNLGLVAFRQGEYLAAQTYLEQSLTLRRDVGDQYGVAAALNNLGMVPYQQGDLAAANRYWQEVYQIRQALGDVWGTAAVLDNLALIAMSQKDNPTATHLFAEAIALRRQLGDQQGLATSLANRGRLGVQMGEWDNAAAHYRESLFLAMSIGDQLGVVFALAGIAAVWVNQGLPERGTMLLGAAATHIERVNGHWESDEEALYQQSISQARQMLSQEAFAAAYAQGQQMSLDAAVNESLAEEAA